MLFCVRLLTNFLCGVAPSDSTSHQVDGNLNLEELRQFMGHKVGEIALFEAKSVKCACDFVRVRLHVFQQHFPLRWNFDLRFAQ